MKGIRMKKTGKWLLTIISKAFVVILVILLLPFAKQLFQLILPDITGEINAQSRILEQKLESSQRLEVTTVEEEGVLEAKTNVIIFGTVGTTTIRYRYTASLGIDLNKVVLTPDSDRIVFLLPEPLILNDGIEALKIDRKEKHGNTPGRTKTKVQGSVPDGSGVSGKNLGRYAKGIRGNPV